MEETINQKKIRVNKYITFKLNDEVYGFEMSKVKEIIGIKEIKNIPESPDYMKGVIKLRSKILPVVDLRLRFSMPESECPYETCIIVVEIMTYQSERCNNQVRKAGMPQQIGVIVDNVSDVIKVKSGEIEEDPSFERGIDTDFIIGLGKVEEKIIILLDIEKALSSEEMTIQLAIEESKSRF